MFNNIYRDKKVLGTGHTGFKGAWLTTWILKLGAKVVGISKDIPTTPCSFSPPMNVKCCFQIWQINKGVKRDIIRLPTIHSHWNFLGFGPKDENNQPTPPEGADFAIRAYGGKCGDIVENMEELKNLRPKSWHWIQCIPSNVEKKALIERFYSLNYSNSKNTARQNSIGKGELIALYSDVYDAKW